MSPMLLLQWYIVQKTFSSNVKLRTEVVVGEAVHRHLTTATRWVMHRETRAKVAKHAPSRIDFEEMEAGEGAR